MNPPLVIGVTGIRQAGKDTLAGLFERLNPRSRPFAFATHLKLDLAGFIDDHFHIDVFAATGADKELIRPLMIAYGMAKRERDPLHWVRLAMGDLRSLYHMASYSAKDPYHLIPVVTDFRFSNEVSYFREQFGPSFKLISLTRSDNPHPPTDEEQKHYREVGAQADAHLAWGGEPTDEARLARAREVAARIGLI